MSKTVTIVPDGGWGWAIVSVSFFFHLMGGLMYASQSVLYMALQDHFQEGKGMTSWILSSYNTMMVLVGPVAASCGVKFGYKSVTFVGGFLMGLGVFISFFATSITFLIMSIGVLAGCGTGLCYVSVIALSALYFDKKRSLAVGIGTSGVGIGGVLFPPLVALWEEEYTWRGIMLIMSGCMFNMCVFALLMRPLPTANNTTSLTTTCDEDNKIFVAERSALMSSGEFVEVTVTEVADDNDPGGSLVEVGGSRTRTNEEEMILSKLMYEVLPSPVDISSSTNSISPKSPPGHDTPLNMGAELMRRNKFSVSNGNERTRSHSFNEKSNASSTKYRNGTQKLPERHFSSAQQLSKSLHSNTSMNVSKENVERMSNYEKRSLSNLSVMFMGSFYNIVGIEPTLSSMLISGSKASMTEKQSQGMEIEDFRYEEIEIPTQIEDERCMSGFCLIIKVYTTLLKNWKCVILLIVNFLVNLTYLTPILYLVDRAVVQNGIERNSAILAISLYGAGNTIGRVCTGLLGNLPCVNRMVLYFTCIFGFGITSILSVFCGSYLSLHVAYGFIVGLFIGGYVILTPVVLVDVLGVEVVAQSLGLCLFSMAFSTIVGTPMAGWIFDITGSYTLPFVLYGSFLVLSSLMLMPLIYMFLKGR